MLLSLESSLTSASSTQMRRLYAVNRVASLAHGEGNPDAEGDMKV